MHDEKRGFRAAGLLLFALASLFALALLRSPGTGDTGIWLDWADAGERLGLRAGYAATLDVYPPLTFVALTESVRAARAVGVEPFTGIKLMLWVFLIASGAVFARWTGSAALGALLLASLTLSAMGLGYTDILLAPFLLSAFRALQEERPVAFAVHFTIAALFKWQPIVVAPIVLLHLLEIRRLGDWPRIPVRRLLAAVAVPAAAIVATVTALMGREVLASLARTRILDPVLSGYALNVPWILTFLLRVAGAPGVGGLDDGLVRYLKPVGLRFTLLPDLAFAIAYLLLCRAALRGERSFAALARRCQTAFLAYFMLASRVHENHLFVAVILGAALVAADAAELPRFLFWAAAFNVNLLLFYGVTGEGPGFSRVVGIDLSLPLAVLLFVAFAFQYAGTIADPPRSPAPR